MYYCIELADVQSYSISEVNNGECEQYTSLAIGCVDVIDAIALCFVIDGHCRCFTAWFSVQQVVIVLTLKIKITTRMWANAQRDGHPAEHSWRPLFNAAKFG